LWNSGLIVSENEQFNEKLKFATLIVYILKKNHPNGILKHLSHHFLFLTNPEKKD
jgi:hypothetical protein